MSDAAMEIMEESQSSDLHPTPTKASPNQSPATATTTTTAAKDLSEKRKREEDDAPPPESPRHPMWKTSLCSFYRCQPKIGSCSHSETCRYAHSEAELRPRPDKSQDPTSDRAKKLKSETEAAAAAEEEEYLATGVHESLLDWAPKELGLRQTQELTRRGPQINSRAFSTSSGMSDAAMEIIEESQSSNLHPTPTKASPNQSLATATTTAAKDLSEKRKREEDDAPPPESSRHPMWKTSLCSFYRCQPKIGSCSHGETCRYAHSEAELRPRPDKSWDPTSDRAKKLKSETEAAAAAEEEYLATGVHESLLDWAPEELGLRQTQELTRRGPQINSRASSTSR